MLQVERPELPTSRSCFYNFFRAERLKNFYVLEDSVFSHCGRKNDGTVNTVTEFTHKDSEINFWPVQIKIKPAKASQTGGSYTNLIPKPQIFGTYMSTATFMLFISIIP